MIIEYINFYNHISTSQKSMKRIYKQYLITTSRKRTQNVIPSVRQEKRAKREYHNKGVMETIEGGNRWVNLTYNFGTMKKNHSQLM